MPRGRPKQTAEDREALRKDVREKLWTPRDPPVGLQHVWLPDPPSKKGTAAYAAWAKECFIELIKHGYNYTQASAYLGYDGYKWVDNTKARDPAWWVEVQAARENPDGETDIPDLSRMTFEEFVRTYIGFELAEHQKEMAAALSDPKGKLVMILAAPEHGKSTTVTLWYVLYKLAQNPDIRIALVSKSAPKAQDLLRRVKRYLTENHLYENAPRNLIKDFGGWQPMHGELEWSNTQIFVKHRKSGERDPTIQALGIGKQIYGTRLDLLILDDSLVLDNQVSELNRDRLDRWFTGEARSRAQRGQTVVCGTRLFPLDLYGQWKKAMKGHPLYRQVIVPAILDEWTSEERPSWPEYWTMDGYDIYEEYLGEKELTGYQAGLRDLRDEVRRKDPDQWRLIYQQEDVEETSNIFRMSHVNRAFDLGAEWRAEQIGEKEILILGVDPAVTGRAAAVLIALDLETRVRRIVEIVVTQRLGATGIRQKLFYYFWDKYRDHGIAETVVEVNFAPTLMGDEAFMQRARDANTRVTPFKTLARGKKIGSKWDDEYGVATLAQLFGNGLIAFPSKDQISREMCQPLIDDMLVFPFAEKYQDVVMALWFANSIANKAQHRQNIDQQEVMERRGVPPNIRNRARRDLVSSRR